MASMRGAIRYALCALLALGGAAAAATRVELYTEEYPPFNWSDQASGKVVGVSTDIVLELMRRAGVVVGTPTVVPWVRGLELAAKQRNTCLFTAARVPEREPRYQWIGPIGRSEWVLFARRADHLRLQSLEQARGYRIGTYIGDASVTYLKERQFDVDAAQSDKLNPKKLQNRHIDLWSVGRLPGLNLLRELGITDLEAVFTFTRADMYLVCSLDMEKSLVARLNALLRAMYLDNTVKRVYTRYGYASEAPAMESLAAGRK